jgi:hypothetical protein
MNYALDPSISARAVSDAICKSLFETTLNFLPV